MCELSEFHEIHDVEKITEDEYCVSIISWFMEKGNTQSKIEHFIASKEEAMQYIKY